MEEATISGLAFGFRFSREVDRVDLRVCLSGASYAAAENGVKNLNGSETIAKNLFRSFQISRKKDNYSFIFIVDIKKF
jgi:hypothetical protein